MTQPSRKAPAAPGPQAHAVLHGVTLERILTALVEEFGWEALAARIDIRCFRFDPSIKSSLVFLRKTPWARARVEALYVEWKTSPSPGGPPPPT